MTIAHQLNEHTRSSLRPPIHCHSLKTHQTPQDSPQPLRPHEAPKTLHDPINDTFHVCVIIITIIIIIVVAILLLIVISLHL